MSLLDVRAALMAKVALTLPDARTWYENKKKQDAMKKEILPPTDRIYFRVFYVPNSRPRMAGIGKGARVRHTGMVQIDVCEPRNVGDVPAQTEVQAILDAFPAWSSLTSGTQTVIITGAGASGGGFNDLGAFAVPVRIFWQADVTNDL